MVVGIGNIKTDDIKTGIIGVALSRLGGDEKTTCKFDFAL
jgi:hypothetical protein